MERYPYQGRFNDYPAREYTQASGSTPSQEWDDDIVCASGKPEDVPLDQRLNCTGAANPCEHKHGRMIQENPDGSLDLIE
jgi:hypothetical protein